MCNLHVCVPFIAVYLFDMGKDKKKEDPKGGGKKGGKDDKKDEKSKGVDSMEVRHILGVLCCVSSDSL